MSVSELIERLGNQPAWLLISAPVGIFLGWFGPIAWDEWRLNRALDRHYREERGEPPPLLSRAWAHLGPRGQSAALFLIVFPVATVLASVALRGH